MAKRIQRPPIGAKMYAVCENLYYAPGRVAPYLEYCVVEGEVTGFYKGGYEEICLVGLYPKYRTPYRRRLSDIGKTVFYTPKEAARIFLRVTDVRAERLHDMTEDDVCAEGAEKIINSCEHMDFSVEPPEPCYNASPCKDCIIDYSYPELFGKMVWDSTIKKNDLARYGWEANPWVWVIEFERMGRDSL